MTQAPQAEMKNSPLDSVHESLGAVMAERDGWSVPASYGDELRRVLQPCAESGAPDWYYRLGVVYSLPEMQTVEILNGPLWQRCENLAEK